jgi:hypothetical protein
MPTTTPLVFPGRDLYEQGMTLRDYFAAITFAAAALFRKRSEPLTPQHLMYVESGWHIGQALSRARSLAVHEFKQPVSFRFNGFDFMVLTDGTYLTNHPDPTMQPGYGERV